MEGGTGVETHNLDLAQGFEPVITLIQGHIEEAGLGADRLVLRHDPRGILERHLPAAEGDHLRLEPEMLPVQGRLLQLIPQSDLLDIPQAEAETIS